MNSKRFTTKLLATTALYLGASTIAMAADAVEQVIVTARRVEERLQDVPISITVYNQQQLTNRNVFTAADLAKYTPSLSTNNRFGADKASFAIRGFTQETNTSPSVGVYFADVVAPRNLAFTTGGNGGGPGSYFDLENVQVLKGPQGTLFGRNTTGGAILLVPKKPTDKAEGYVEASYGNYNMERLQAVVNVPVSSKVRSRFGFDQMTRQGYLNNISGIGPAHFADVNYIAARGSVVIDLNDNLENYTIFTYSRSDTNGMLNHLFACQSDPTTRASAGAFMGDAACAQVARDSGSIFTVEASEANPRSLIDLWQVINTTTWTANDALTIKNIGSYSEYKEIYQNNASGDNLIMPSSLNLVRGGVVTAVPTGAFAGAHYNFVGLDTHPNYPYTSAQRSMTDELQAHGRVLDNRLMWQAGGYMELSEPLQTVGQLTSTLASCANLNTLTCTDVLSQIVAGGAAAVGTASTRSIRNRFQDYGLYGQGTFEITHQLSMTAGLRYTWDRHRQEGAQLTYNFPPVKGVPAGGVVTFCSNSLVFRPRKFTTKESDCAVSYLAESHRPTWLVDLEYKPIDDVMVWAKYARGYRQGLANTAAPGFEILQPEKVDSYELGAKTSFGGSMPGTFDIVGFYNNLENQQIQASAVARVGSGVSSSNTVINAGKSKIEGVEVDATIKPVEPVTVNLGYTYLKTQLESLTLPDLSTNPLFGSFSVTAAVGGPLVLSPKNKVVLGVTYKMPVPERLGEVSVGGNFVHTDSQLTSAASPLGHVPATDLLNLNLNWNSVAESQVDLSVFATNVTNKKYPAFVVGSLLSTAFEGSIAAEPAMYGLRLRYRFGG